MAAASLSLEEENYVRLSLLLTGISPRAVRVLFDFEFAPLRLGTTIKRKHDILNDLRQKNIISKSQWDLLFPRHPGVPASNKFDISLMIILLRHLTSPCGDYDKYPTITDITTAADLARVKYYRNYLAHLQDVQVDIAFFNNAWTDVTGAIERLGGQAMKQECILLKTKPLDQNNQEIMISIKIAVDEIRELKESLTDFKRSFIELMKSHEEAKNAHKLLEEQMKNHLQDTIPWNIREQNEQILESWRVKDMMYIYTRASQYILKSLETKSCVTIIASSGVGKTATLQHVALQMGKKGYDVIIIIHPDDIIKFHNPYKKTLFVIDDLCGNYSFNQNEIKVWEPVIKRITEILNNNQTKIIVACRLQVYQDDKFDTLSIFKSCVCNLLSDSICLLKTEKQLIAEIYLKVKASEISSCYDLYDCFPLLCELYHNNPTPNIKDFFQNPFSVFENELHQLQKESFPGKFCGLALCVIFNNNLEEDMLTEDINEETRAIIENTYEACSLNKGTSRLAIKKEIDSLLNTFLIKEHKAYVTTETDTDKSKGRQKSYYKTIHDKLFDFFVYYFGLKINYCLIKNAHSRLIRERFLLERRIGMDKFITVVPAERHKLYIQRMIHDWSNGKIQDVFGNINMTMLQFKKKFTSFLNEFDRSYQDKLAHICDIDNKNSVLLQCCLFGDLAMVEWCLNHSVDVNRCSSNGQSPLMIVSKSGHTKIAMHLIENEADCNKCNKFGRSPLMIACEHGHLEIVKLLLEGGADFDLFNYDGQSAEMIACVQGHTHIVMMMIHRDEYTKKYNKYDQSTIMFACKYGHYEIVQSLLDRGANYRKCDKWGISPLMTACEYGHKEICSLLLERETDYDNFGLLGWSLVMIACRYNRTDILRMIISKDSSHVTTTYNDSHTDMMNRRIDFDHFDNHGLSPLLVGCLKGNTEIVRILLDKGVDCNNSNYKTTIHDFERRDIFAYLKSELHIQVLSPILISIKYGHTEIFRMMSHHEVKHQLFLKLACIYGHIDILRILLDREEVANQRVDIISKEFIPITCKYGHIDMLRFWLEKGADCYDYYDYLNYLNIAYQNGKPEIAKTLIENGAPVINTSEYISSQISACKYGKTEFIRRFEDTMDTNECDSGGSSLLMYASTGGHLEIVKILLDKGAECDKYNDLHESAILLACEHGHSEIVKLLLDKGADVNTYDWWGETPLMIACKKGYTEILKIMLSIGENCKKCDNGGRSLVHIACSNGQIDTVNMLLEIGADYNKSDNNGMSPLMSASVYGLTEIVSILLKKEADYDECDNYGFSSIMHACANNHTEIVKVLLDKGADANKCNVFGQSPLIVSCELGYSEIADVLLDSGADFNKYNMFGKSVIQTACENGETDIVRMLLKKGAVSEKWENVCHSPLMSACANGHTEIVRMLLEKGNNYEKYNRWGMSPVQTAGDNGHAQIVQLLLDN